MTYRRLTSPHLDRPRLARRAGHIGHRPLDGTGDAVDSRLSTGLGIGGLLATLNALVSEAAARRTMPLTVALMTSGFSLGGLTGGRSRHGYCQTIGGGARS